MNSKNVFNTAVSAIKHTISLVSTEHNISIEEATAVVQRDLLKELKDIDIKVLAVTDIINIRNSIEKSIKDETVKKHYNDLLNIIMEESYETNQSDS